MTTQREAPDANALKERQVKIWTSGEYARIGNPISIMGEILCEAVDLRSGDRVLDVATGSGNTAISAARRFCEVTGMDLAPESIEQARRRRSGGHGDNVRGRRRRGSVLPRRFLRRGSLHHRGDVLPEPGEGGE
jgi:protein-L-isoaspartate O-methyltransferase